MKRKSVREILFGTDPIGGTTASSGSTLDADKIRRLYEQMRKMEEKALLDAAMKARAAKMAKGGAIPPGAGMAGAGSRRRSARPAGAMSGKERALLEQLVKEAISDLRAGDPLHHRLSVSFVDPYAAMHHEVEVMVTLRPVSVVPRYSGGPSFYASYSTAFGAPPYDPAWSSRAAPPPKPKPSEPRHPYYEWCDKNP
jgi:hypothetical protein